MSKPLYSTTELVLLGIDDPQEFARYLTTAGHHVQRVPPLQLGKRLEELARAHNKEGFRSVVTGYCTWYTGLRTGGTPAEHRTAAFNELEFACQLADHFDNGIDKEQLSVGKTQRYFRTLYKNGKQKP